MSLRPRKSERNSLTLSTGLWGIGALTARGGRTWISGSESNAANSARRAASRSIASACCVSSVTRRASSCAMARCNASRLVPPTDGASRQIRPCSGSSCMSSSPGALVTRRVAIDRVGASRLSSLIFKQNHMLMIASLDRRRNCVLVWKDRRAQVVKPKRQPRCVLIAGPNGAGKTTFARRYLPEDAGVIHFVNADLIASGLSPLKPELAAIAAARMVLREIDRLAAERMDFAFETTFSGFTYVRRLQTWKQAGYRIEMVYLRLRSVQLALRRIAARVRQGGHDVPRADVVRRFSRGWRNFQRIYRPLADSWAVYDNSGRSPRLLEKSP